LKRLIPVRLIKNEFYEQINSLEINGGSRKELFELLGKGRAKKGMFDGDINDGELEIGQVSGLIKEIKPAGKIIEEIISEFKTAKKELEKFKF